LLRRSYKLLLSRRAEGSVLRGFFEQGVVSLITSSIAGLGQLWAQSRTIRMLILREFILSFKKD
jgi:hypothetical protein